MTPMMLSFIVGAMVSGQLLTRTGRYKAQAVVGGALLAFGAWLLTLLGVDSTWGEVVRDMVVLGVGIGSLMPAMGTIVQNLFPYRIMGAVNATQQTVSGLAGAIAAPIFGGVMTNHFSAKLAETMPPELQQMLAGLTPDQRAAIGNPQDLVSAGAQEALAQQFAAFGAQGQALYQGFIGAVHESLAYATARLYELGLVSAILAFLVTFFLREVPLKRDEYYREGMDEGVGAEAEAEAEAAVGSPAAGQ